MIKFLGYKVVFDDLLYQANNFLALKLWNGRVMYNHFKSKISPTGLPYMGVMFSDKQLDRTTAHKTADQL